MSAVKTASLSSQQTHSKVKVLKKMHCQTDKGKYSFTQRVGLWWNSLPQIVIDMPTVNAFKKKLDEHFKYHPVVYSYNVLDSGQPADDCPLRRATFP